MPHSSPSGPAAVSAQWTIGFDADDTLWHNERLFQMSSARFVEMLGNHADISDVDAHILATQRRNLPRYGFGVKPFILSLIETALDLTGRNLPGEVIADILAMGQDMIDHPIELLPHARDQIEALCGVHRLLLITKGDLLHQEQKLARSGLGHLFDGIEIVSDKTAPVYARIFSQHPATHHMMIGNSMKSDVIPAIEAGAWGVFVPHDLAWEMEHAEPPEHHPKYRAIADLSDLGALIESLS